MGARAGTPDADRSWTELPSPTRLATAPSVAKGAAFVFPRDCGSLQPAGRRWLAVLGRIPAWICARLAAAVALLVLSSAGMAASAADDLVRSGTLTVEQVQIAFIGSGNLGGGTLTVGGQKYSFSIGGLGIGGIGVSRMEATGTVYNLKNINDFAGGYVQARYGIAVGSMSTGQLWLQNTKGVVLELKAKRTGLALSLGGDAVYINFD
ncbi:MAG TPA: hypothetical protein VJ790_17265 [Dongiaceae bacterium]|nr:hypothetical protein [Dongiaceae bacterium]